MLRWALSSVYLEGILPTGPMYVSAKPQNGAMIVSFDVTGKGLVTTDGKPPASFALAGADHKWHWADAKIINDHEVKVWSIDVDEPVAVRYAFNNNPEDPNLTNDTKLPAAPFRSDNWAGPTHDKR